MADENIGESHPNGKGVRSPVPQRVRFEVFKRDKFTCQYCGQSAPSVVLECDHIEPVAEGGTNDIINLITSCRPCNGGKGAIPLSDQTAVTKQQAMLADLEERRQQIEMMMQWRTELRSHDEDISKRIAQMCSRGGLTCSENGLATIRKWLKRYSADEIVSAVDESFDIYGLWEDGRLTPDSWEKAFGKIPGLVSIKRQETDKPHIRRILYVQGIIRNRLRVRRLDWIDYLDHLAVCGADLDEMETRAKRMRTREDFENHYDAWLVDIGRPF